MVDYSTQTRATVLGTGMVFILWGLSMTYEPWVKLASCPCTESFLTNPQTIYRDSLIALPIRPEPIDDSFTTRITQKRDIDLKALVLLTQPISNRTYVTQPSLQGGLGSLLQETWACMIKSRLVGGGLFWRRPRRPSRAMTLFGLADIQNGKSGAKSSYF